jgi:hypothetical protein
MRILATLGLVAALAACEDASFNGASDGRDSKAGGQNRGSPGDKMGKATIPVGDTAKVQDIPGAGPSGDGDDGKIKTIESKDPEVAKVGKDGTITGIKPGETTIEVTYEDGTTATVEVEVVVGSDDGTSAGQDGTGTDQSGGGIQGGSDSTTGAGGLGAGEGQAGKQGCKIAGDRISWSWPKEIQDCFDAKRIWDFTRNTCTAMPQSTSFACTFDGIDAAVEGINANFTPNWDKKRVKLIACGERDKPTAGLILHTVAWQYILLPEEAKDGACNFDFGAGIAVGCFETTLFNLQSSSPADVQKCLDGGD